MGWIRSCVRTRTVYKALYMLPDPCSLVCLYMHAYIGHLSNASSECHGYVPATGATHIVSDFAFSKMSTCLKMLRRTGLSTITGLDWTAGMDYWNGLHGLTFFALKIICMAHNKICLPIHALYRSYLTQPPASLSTYIFSFFIM